MLVICQFNFIIIIMFYLKNIFSQQKTRVLASQLAPNITVNALAGGYFRFILLILFFKIILLINKSIIFSKFIKNENDCWTGENSGQRLY